MDLVQNESQVVENILRFNSYAHSPDVADINFFGDLLRRGHQFAYMRHRGQFLFCPSRFVGYVGNTRSLHVGYPFKTGLDTTPAISQALQQQLNDSDSNAEVAFIALCERLELEVPKRPLRRGSTTEVRPRAYWFIAGNYDSSDLPDPLIADTLFPEETYRDELFVVGSVMEILVNRYERDPGARKTCLKHFGGASCQICKLDLGQKYGELGNGFIHVHHLLPETLRQEGYEIDPKTELLPVCPNCHAMLHYGAPKDRPRTPDELRKRMAQGK